MNKVFALALVILSGCTTAERIGSGSETMDSIPGNPAPGDGLANKLTEAWSGQINQVLTKELDGGAGNDVYQVIMLNCDGSPEFYLQATAACYQRIRKQYTVVETAGNILLYKIDEGSGWVETQLWSLVIIDQTQAAIQWNRIVSNPYLDSREQYRSFGQLAHGMLRKTSDSCDILAPAAQQPLQS